MSLLEMKKGENRSSKSNENDFFLKIKKSLCKNKLHKLHLYKTL